MSKKGDANSSADSKGATPEKKGGEPTKKVSETTQSGGERSEKTSAAGATREVQTLTVEQLLTRGSLIERSKKPLSYLLDKTQPANRDTQIWLCWPDGCVSIDDIGTAECGYVVMIERNK